MNKRLNFAPVRNASIVLGVGLGGFIDGIVLHQILQWHHLLTSAGYPPTTVDNLQINTLADGLFHASAWIITAIGLAMLWRAGQRRDTVWSARVFVGALAIGWGLFNLVEGLINHQILGIHHVRPGPNELLYDLAFLTFGAALVVGGWLLARQGQRQPVRAAGK